MTTLLSSILNSENVNRKIHHNCFKVAAELIQQLCTRDFLKDHRLVHGNLASLNQDKPVNHAWLEELDFVYDVSNGHKKLILKDDYYLGDEITRIKKYTVCQAINLIESHSNWGPWE